MKRTPKQILEEYHLKPNKALGQNFLNSPEICERIAEACSCEGRTVLEIGPGLGALTGNLLSKAKRLVAVEKDGEMVRILQEEYPDPKLEVVKEDFLKYDIRDRIGQEPFIAAGNLPYYVTSPISERLICMGPERAVLMVQKEASERFLAKPGSRAYGPLCILSQLLYEPEFLFSVQRHHFWPQPEVDSAVIRLERREYQRPQETEQLMIFLKHCFRMRRKTMKNQFAGEERMLDILSRSNLEGARAESLSPEELYSLFKQQKEESGNV